MLNLRRETDYAIHMLKFLSKRGKEFVSLRDLSNATGISFLFLQKIARKLRIARLIKAEAGISGGYCLNISANRISLKKIIESVEGPIAILPCLCKETSVKCQGAGKKCFLKNKLSKMNRDVGKMLEKIKLSSL